MESDTGFSKEFKSAINTFMSNSNLKLQSNQKCKLGHCWKSKENENYEPES